MQYDISKDGPIGSRNKVENKIKLVYLYRILQGRGELLCVRVHWKQPKVETVHCVSHPMET